MKLFDEEDDLNIGVDLTPLLDVLFIFLLFFVITATFSAPMMPMNLAKSKSARVQKAEKEDILVHLVGGEIFSEKEKIEDLEDFFKSLPREGNLIFQIAEDESFGDFMNLIDSAKTGGRDDFLIQTRKD